MSRRPGRQTATALVAVLAAAAVGCAPGADPADGGAVTTAVESPSSVADTWPSGSPEVLAAFGEQLLEETGATGGIVAVRSGAGEPVIVAVGREATADGSEGPPVDPGAPLQVASVTKSYVAALALVLEADAVVDLDEPISRWLAWPGGDEITLRHLLTHTSGVGRFGDGESPSPFLDLVARGRPVTTAEALDAAREVAPLAEPGGATRYGNLNYLLAGAVLEAATGEPLGELFRSRLFAPLALTHTWYPPDQPDGIPVGLFEVEPGIEPIATSEVPLDGWQTALGASSGATATVDDLLAWSDAVFRRQVVDGVDVAAMTAISPDGYGLGVIGVGPDGDCIFDGCPPGVTFERWALNGDFPGASTRVLHDPATDTTLVVYLNRNSLELDPSLDAFLDERSMSDDG